MAIVTGATTAVIGLVLVLGFRMIAGAIEKQAAAAIASAAAASPDAAVTSSSTTLSTEALAAAFPIIAGLMLVFVTISFVGGIAVTRAAAVHEGIRDHFLGALKAAGPQMAQGGIIMAPVMVWYLVAFAVGMASPILGFLLLLPGFALTLATTPFALVSVVATALGDRALTPRLALSLVRPQLVHVALVVAAMWAVVVIVCVPLGIAGTVVPLLGPVVLFVGQTLVNMWCVGAAVSLYRELGGPEGVAGGPAPVRVAPGTRTDGSPADVHQPAAADPHGVDPAAAAADSNSAPVSYATQAAAPAPPPAHPAGPTELTGVLQPSVPAGEWIPVHMAGTAHIQVAWSDGPPLVIALAAQDGTWLAVPAMSENGGATPLTIPAPGQYYVQVSSQGGAPQSYRAALHPPAHAAPQAA